MFEFEFEDGRGEVADRRVPALVVVTAEPAEHRDAGGSCGGRAALAGQDLPFE